jgi:hypothetical protein
LENLNANKRQEGKIHIAQGVESTIGSVIGDNIDEVQKEHVEESYVPEECC